MPKYDHEGYRQGVLFLFWDGQCILIEHRPTGETFIPGGSIEETDLVEGEDYRIVAMKREVAEELAGQVEILEHISLGAFRIENPKLRAYGYLITRWNGPMPAYTIERGVRYSGLEWIPLADYKRHLSVEPELSFVEKAKAYLSGQRDPTESH